MIKGFNYNKYTVISESEIFNKKVKKEKQKRLDNFNKECGIKLFFETDYTKKCVISSPKVVFNGTILQLIIIL